MLSEELAGAYERLQHVFRCTFHVWYLGLFRSFLVTNAQAPHTRVGHHPRPARVFQSPVELLVSVIGCRELVSCDAFDFYQ
jgi:hypothetical protein